MSARIGEHIRSNVVTYLVAFLAVTVVPAFAATPVKVPKNAVKSKQIKDGQVKAVDVDSSQVQLRVAGACPAGTAIRTVNADGTVACELDDIGGGGAPLGPAGGDLTGTYPNPQIANLAVGTAKLADLAVTIPKLADGTALGEIADDDGAESGLDADLLDGQNSAAFAVAGHNHDSSYWKLGGNSGTTTSDFLGTTDNQALELRVSNARALRLEPTATSPNLIGGFSGNNVTAGASGATIAGGGGTGNLNTVTDDGGTVSGGRNNRAGNGAGTTADRPFATVGGGSSNIAIDSFATVGGGFNNLASGSFATVGGGTSSDAAVFGTVAGGFDNSASGSEATVGGGFTNIASDGQATVGGGGGNTASSPLATIPGGNSALANHFGQLAYAGGSFVVNGNSVAGGAQTSTFVVRQDTSGTTAEELFLDGSSLRMTVPSGGTWAFEALVVARASNGQSAGYRIEGLIENVSGVTAIIGTPTTTVLAENDAAWDVTVAGDDANNALTLTALGNTGDTARWVAMVRTTEVLTP